MGLGGLDEELGFVALRLRGHGPQCESGLGSDKKLAVVQQQHPGKPDHSQ